MTTKFYIEPLTGIDEQYLEWAPVDMTPAPGQRVRVVLTRPSVDPKRQMSPLAVKLLGVGLAKAQVR